MKKVKIKERFEKAVEAFFENEEQFENSQIVLNNTGSALLADQPERETAEKADSIISFVKLVFLFVPGAFFLYRFLMIFVFYTMYQGIEFRSNLGLHDLLFFKFFLDNPVSGIFFVLAGIFMTFIGIGSLRETKNLVVPGVIISFSLLLGLLFSWGLTEPLRGMVVMYYSVYLFPIILIVAGFIKRDWVNKNEESEN